MQPSSSYWCGSEDIWLLYQLFRLGPQTIVKMQALHWDVLPSLLLDFSVSQMTFSELDGVNWQDEGEWAPGLLLVFVWHHNRLFIWGLLKYACQYDYVMCDTCTTELQAVMYYMACATRLLKQTMVSEDNHAYNYPCYVYFSGLQLLLSMLTLKINLYNKFNKLKKKKKCCFVLFFSPYNV